MKSLTLKLILGTRKRPLQTRLCLDSIQQLPLYLITKFTSYQGSLKRIYIQIYDVETDKWSLGATSISGISTGVAVSTTGVLAPKKIYVLDYSAVRGYSPENGTWILGADVLKKLRFNFGAAILNDAIYVIGGYTYKWLPGDFYPMAANERYTPFGYGTVPHEPEPEPFPIVPVAAASAASVVVAVAGLLVYFRKRNRQAGVSTGSAL